MPANVLALTSVRRPPSTATALALSVGWLASLFALQAFHPVQFYGEFPWWMFRRDFLEVLPVPLALTLAFPLTARLRSRSEGSGLS